MKNYNPKTMKPDPTQFFDFVKGQISDQGQQSLAFKLVADLYRVSQSMYKHLDSLTSESLTLFDGADYLTETQEHDLVALTAVYVGNLRTQTIHDAVEQDTVLTDSEKVILRAALENFRASAASASAALGHPRWVEK